MTAADIADSERKEFIPQTAARQRNLDLPSHYSNRSSQRRTFLNSKYIKVFCLFAVFLFGYTRSSGNLKKNLLSEIKYKDEGEEDLSKTEFKFVDSPPSEEEWEIIDDYEDDEDEDVGEKDEEESYVEEIHYEENIPVETVTATSKSDSEKKYAWLMSFPNSGTSYTMKLVRHVSNRTTATNYRKNPLSKDEADEYIPKITAVENGDANNLEPFISNDNTLDLPPSGYLLTKTHCGGRCSTCAPHTYLESQETFLEHCLELQFGVPFFHDDDDDDLSLQKYSAAYSPSQIEKAVHLFRSPFDNAISRFHLHRLHETDEWKETHPKNAEGFQLYCQEMNQLYEGEEREIDVTDNDVNDFPNLSVHSDKVPCHGELHRYIAWHENVLKITRSMLEIPTHVVYYEDYRDDFENAIEGILGFLELPRLVDTTPPFHISDYSDHFTNEQQEEAIAMMKHQASADLWELISSRYGF